MTLTLTEVLELNKPHLVIMTGDIEDLNSSEIEELLLAGKHLCSRAYEYAVNYIGIDTMDIMYYLNTDSWGF